MSRVRHVAMTALVLALIAALPAVAQVELRFVPPDQHIAVGETGSLAVILDDALEIRTVEMLVSYDETVVASIGGQAGEVFANSGCGIFPAFDEDVAGTWYGGAATLGPDCYLTEPGELYRWSFEGIADGICQVQVDGIVLYGPQAEIIPDVTLAGTTIIVGDISAVGPPLAKRLTLSLAPNPFNPRTVIRFDGPQDEPATVEVFDLCGRRLAVLWSGRLGSEPGAVSWDGTDHGGRNLPGGAYLFRIRGQKDRHVTRKGILLQ